MVPGCGDGQGWLGARKDCQQALVSLWEMDILGTWCWPGRLSV